ncbi:MAG TPA: hypothetical protein VME69_06450 [Methylocella sp.]|nr:hypothetical protein [Methylocella sp.]
MSSVGDALKAIRQVLLLEERITSQSHKLEQLALAVVEMDKRLAALEGRMEGFLAAASAFGGGAGHPAKLIEIRTKDPPERAP